MTYLATSINDSAVITEKAGAALDDVRGKAVKYDTAGNVVLCSTAGEAAIGIGLKIPQLPEQEVPSAAVPSTIL